MAQNVIHAEHRFPLGAKWTAGTDGQRRNMVASITMNVTLDPSVPAVTYKARESNGPFSIDWLTRLDSLNLRP